MKMATFKERLKELRAGKGLSQRALADELHISKSAVSMYENGTREPDHETTELIADYFNVDIDYLLGRKDYTMQYVKVHPEGQCPQYYDNAVVQTVTDKLRTNPEYGVMFKAAADVKPEDVDFVVKLIEKMSD